MPTYSDFDKHVVEDTIHWLEEAVIGLNLCPFARRVHAKRQVRYRVSDATTEDALGEQLVQELLLLHDTPPETHDTTLIMHPHVLHDFLAFNDFLGMADDILVSLGLAGEIQIASFHPHYRFADTDGNDITNATNRAPYPTLHLLREASVESGIRDFPAAESIYLRNMETMRRLGPEGWEDLMRRRRRP